MENFTASAFRGVPSWNFTPLRSLKVYWRPSFDMVQDSARPGTICVLSSGKVTSVSTTRRPTRFELRSVTWAGSRLTGSATSPTRSVPAGWAATGSAARLRASASTIIAGAIIDENECRAGMVSLLAGFGVNGRHHTLRPYLAQASARRALAPSNRDLPRRGRPYSRSRAGALSAPIAKAPTDRQGRRRRRAGRPPRGGPRSDRAPG